MTPELRVGEQSVLEDRGLNSDARISTSLGRFAREIPARISLVPRPAGSLARIGAKYRGLVRFLGVDGLFVAEVEEYSAEPSVGQDVPVTLRIWAGDRLPEVSADQPFELYDGQRFVGRGVVGDGLLAYRELAEELVAAVPELTVIVDQWRTTWDVDQDDPPLMWLFYSVVTEYAMPLLRKPDPAKLDALFALVERMAAGPPGFRTERVQLCAWAVLDALLGHGADLEVAERHMGPATRRLYEKTRVSGAYRLPRPRRVKRRWPWQRT